MAPKHADCDQYREPSHEEPYSPFDWLIIGPGPAQARDAAQVRSVRQETFPATEEQVSQARQVTRQTLVDHPAVDLAVLLVSELTSNSVRHSGSRFFTLAIRRTFEGHLRIGVTDEGRHGLPRLVSTDFQDESGRGMRLVDALARQWGIIRRPAAGMAVWFDVDHTIAATGQGLFLLEEP
ncbi:hypothetical protein Sru01_17140 [Sphaerisporangium rufum]|uniref:Histidine kinase/HSP90-like ATPase domain-containing protein n=1 Tax=Sphaerisporangium rufum TaxID=1381558 RepID=A0A919R466_9ACTN|nr:ATP-binding protein [Sphaerisporangium rufum]GII76732.1 hypothetical protein Sru01_17140 [Sphaerisporangium rufum]